MRIRPYAPDDWPRVCEIHDAARRDELAAAGLQAAYLTLEQTAGNEGFHDYTIHVAEVDRRIIGFVAFTPEDLAWLYVDPAAYRQGIGTALIRHVLAEVGGPVAVEVLEGNDAAVAAYRKAGFVQTGRASGRMPGNEGFEVTVVELQHPGAPR